MLSNQLKAMRMASGMSQKELARRLFLSQQAVAKYESGASSPSPETLSNIATILNTSIDILLGRIPETTALTGGVYLPFGGPIPAELILGSNDEKNYEEIDKKLASLGDFFGFVINDDSMTPDIKDRDLVIAQKQHAADDNNVVIAIVNGNKTTCRRIKKIINGIILMPNNPVYDPMLYTTEEIESMRVRIVGKVVELRRNI